MTRQKPEHLKVACPYCRAAVGEMCKVKQGNVYTQNTPCWDQWGRPTVHESRIKIAAQQESQT